MNVDIWSDFACPFCYIGKRKFEQALETFEHADQLKVRWHSYQLTPGLKTDPSVNIHEHLAEIKNWSVEQARKINASVTATAAEVGLEYNFDQTIPANTLNAHRLSHLAADHDLQDEAEERLFAAYFTEGRNIDDPETLVQIGEEIGLNADQLRELFQTGRYADKVLQDQQEAGRIGVQGVPFFVFNNKYAVSGAQPVELFLKTMDQAYQEFQKEQPEIQTISGTDGPSCDPETGC